VSRRSRPPETTGGSDEREARSLNVPVVHVGLGQEVARLRSEQEFSQGDRNARTLAKLGAFRLVIVVFRSGAQFDELDQRGTVALQVLEGRLELQVEAETVEISEAEIAIVAPNHDWRAVTRSDGVLLLHLAWPPEPGSESSGPLGAPMAIDDATEGPQVSAREAGTSSSGSTVARTPS
jgi:quercetin dioxygenase-like cupin family protein